MTETKTARSFANPVLQKLQNVIRQEASFYPLGDTPALTKEAAIQARNCIIEGIKRHFRQS